MKKYEVKQENIKDCGVACLSSVIQYYKGYIGFEKLREMTKTTKDGTTAYHIKKTLLDLGFSCQVIKYEKQELIDEIATTPCIAHVVINKSYNHYIVIYKIDKIKQKIKVMDPAIGYKTYSFEEFKEIWSNVLILFYPLKKIPVFKNKVTIVAFTKKITAPHKKIIVSIAFLSLLFTIFNIANSFYFKYIIDNANVELINNFYLVSFIFALIIIMKLSTDYLRNRLLIYINKKIDITLFLNSINHIISLPYNYYKNRTTGEIISRINDLSYIRDMISRVSITLFVDLILVTFALIFLYTVNQVLFIITVIVLILYLVIVLIFNPTLQKYIVKNIEEQAEVTSSMIESINLFETTKGLHLENEVKGKIATKYDSFITNIFKFNKVYNLQNTIKDTVGYMGAFMILFAGTILVFDNQITLGTLITYNALFLYFLEPIRNVIDLEPMIRQAHTSIKRIIQLYEIDPEKFEPNDQEELITGDIVFNNLNFSYNDKDYILKDFNLNIKQGEKILLVGHSGSGKSTLVKLLLRYYKTNQNQLVIDNKDLNDYNLDNIRNSISYVSQNEILITDTVYNNIDMNRGFEEEEIKKIGNEFMVAEIVDKNPTGYNLLLEENGFNISGGERQKIILARALLKDSSILILDESTSQIDLKSERTIFSNLIKNYQTKTIIVISHRKENKDLFDRVITLSKKGE